MLTRWDRRGDAHQDGLVVVHLSPAAIPECDVVDVDRQRSRGQRARRHRLRRPGRQIEDPEQAAHARNGGLGLIEHLGELSDGLEKTIGEEDEADQRARCQAADGAPGNADAHHRGHRERAEDLARREEKRADRAGAYEGIRPLFGHLLRP